MELIVNQVNMHFQEKYAVNNVSFRLHEGIHVLMGENGAGKSTLLRIVGGVLRPDSGSVRLKSWNRFSGRGGPFARELYAPEEEYRSLLGYLPQEIGFYPEFTGRDFLEYLASLKGLTKKQAVLRTKELLKLISLEDAADKKMRKYSTGMQKRLGVAQTLLNNPKLLILDEPTAGLDPVEQIHFLDLIREIGKDTIVLLSLHTIAEAEYLADSVLFMKDGRLVYQGGREQQSGGLEALFLKYEETDRKTV